MCSNYRLNGNYSCHFSKTALIPYPKYLSQSSQPPSFIMTFAGSVNPQHRAWLKYEHRKHLSEQNLAESFSHSEALASGKCQGLRLLLRPAFSVESYPFGTTPRAPHQTWAFKARELTCVHATGIGFRGHLLCRGWAADSAPFSLLHRPLPHSAPSHASLRQRGPLPEVVFPGFGNNRPSILPCPWQTCLLPLCY